MAKYKNSKGEKVNLFACSHSPPNNVYQYQFCEKRLKKVGFH